MSLLDKASLIVTPNAYKESKLYSVVPNTTLGDMDVVRATTATRVNASGLIESVGVNIPRIDYTNGSCPSLLVEPQRTNLNLYSEDFGNASWNKFGSLTISANSTTSPSGISNADKVIPNAGTGTFAVSQSFTKATSNITYTLSGFTKESGYNFLLFRIDSGAGNGIKGSFNIANGTIATTFSTQGIGFTFINADIRNANNGWVKWSVTFTSDLSSLLRPIIYVSNVDGNPFLAPSYTANGTSGIYIWGAQFEQGSYATSYIPTVASTSTRNADIISKTGISSLIGQTEGTLFCDVTLNSRVSFSYFAIATNLASAANYLGIAFLNNAIAFESVVAGALQANISYSNTSTGRFKIAAAYKANDFVLYINGTQIGVDTSGTIPTCSEIGLSVFNQAQALNYNSAQLYKTRLKNAELAQLTTL